MAFYNGKVQLNLERDVLGIGLGAGLLWFPRNDISNNAALQPETFMSKSLTSIEIHYSNTKREALAILNGLEKFCHYCSTCEFSIVTDHKALVTQIASNNLCIH